MHPVETDRTAMDRSLHLPGGRTGILLMHGLGGTPVELRVVALGLAGAGFTVSCPQLAGHCGSFDELKTTSWLDWYQSVQEAHDRLRTQCDVIVAGGLSMGALLALELAAQRPRGVHGAALFAPTLSLDGWGIPWYARLFRLVAHKRIADLIEFREREPYGVKDARVRQIVTAALQSGDSSQCGRLSTPGSSMLELRWLASAVKAKLRAITQPVLVLHPREDDRASLHNAFYLQQQLGGSVEAVVLEDSYHIVTLDRQRHAVIERTAGFARRVTAEFDRRGANPGRFRAAKATAADAIAIKAA
jgi:carboxylesterase